jgi:prepilin-type N-terminal cleavage/methylation domain-containing protein
MKLPAATGRRAFTLLEIMVAMSIFCLVVATIYSTWILIVRSAVVAQNTAARVQRERVAVHTVENALMCVQSFQASMKYYSFYVENGPEPVFSFTSRLPDVFPRSGRFEGVDSNGRQINYCVRRVTFSLEAGADQQKDLVLRQSPILMDLDEVERNTPLVLAHDVKDFLVECWDTNAIQWDTEWDNTNSIPPLVRLTFTMGSRLPDGTEAPPLTLTRLIALPCNTLPASAQTPRGMAPGALPGPGPGAGQGAGQGNNPARNPATTRPGTR